MPMTPKASPDLRPPTAAGAIDERLSELFDTSYSTMVRLAHLLVGDRPTAEDLVQDAFVRLHSRLGGLKDPDAAGGYLRQIVINLCRSHHRRRTLRLRHRPDPLASTSETSPRSDERLAVVAALRTLPRRQRECLVLRYYVDLSEDEIARTLNISAGAVKTHTARGRTTLARLLGEPE